jgi:hypothetical protein
MTLKPCPIDAANLVAALTAPEASFDCDCEPSCSMCFKCFVRSQAIALAQWYLESLAAQDAEKVAGWQAIESAPKDGTPVLVVENIDGRQVVGEAYCCPDDESFYWAQESPHDYPEPDKLYPTHWMPLPPSPKEEST